jgi:RNA polymerase sigma-70 factor, ECF subfamily
LPEYRRDLEKRPARGADLVTLLRLPDTLNVRQTIPAAAFGDLYRRYSRDVYRFALSLTGDAASAEDITAETFLRVWSSPSPVHLETVKAYLLAIARNVFLHELRGRSRRLSIEDAGEPAVASHHRDAEAKDELEFVLEDLRALPEPDRTALLLRAGDGLAYQEIAAILGISTGAARVKVHRARLVLAEQRVRRAANSEGTCKSRTK